MNFVKQTKYMIASFASFGVIGLVVLYIRERLSIGTPIGLSLDESRVSFIKVFLMTYETFWLVAISYGFYKLSKYATKKATKEREAQVEHFEARFFQIMISILVITALLTLLVPNMFGDGLPQFNNANPSGIDIPVEAKQFEFLVNGDAGSTDLSVNTLYNFKLTTTDTTHGFGIYDPGGVFLLQAQIVPGYTTNLVFTFDEAGDWEIRCMEYCGLGHGVMTYVIHIA